MIPTIRLVAPDGILRDVAPRLRGATICSDASSNCDAVAFLTHPTIDDPALDQQLQSGKHLLLSAELCSSVSRLQALTELARQSGAQLALANWERYHPSRQLLRQQLDSGKLGAPGLIRLHYWGQPDSAHSLVSELDLVLWYFGQSPNLVHAIERECLLVHLGFPGGGMSLIDRWISPRQREYRSLSIIASDGAGYADDQQNMQLVFKDGNAAGLLAHCEFGFFAPLVQEFVDGLNAGRDLSASVTGWRNALLIADAVQKSIETRQAIVPEGLC